MDGPDGQTTLAKNLSPLISVNKLIRIIEMRGQWRSWPLLLILVWIQIWILFLRQNANTVMDMDMNKDMADDGGTWMCSHYALICVAHFCGPGPGPGPGTGQECPPQDDTHFELVCLNSLSGLISSCRFSTFCSHFRPHFAFAFCAGPPPPVFINSIYALA